MKLDEFVTINAPAADAASRALTLLTGRPASVKLREARLIDLSEPCPDLDPEAVVASVHLPLLSGLQGCALLYLPEPHASALSAMLTGTVAGRTGAAPGLDDSALMELGNIVCGNYVTALANRLAVRVVPGVPRLARGRFGPILAELLPRLDFEARRALRVKVELDLPAGMLVGYLLMCLETARLIDA